MEVDLRPVTVLFADIHSFTAPAEQLDPEHVTEALEPCLTALSAAIEDRGGHIDKILGDGIMALFGPPIASNELAAHGYLSRLTGTVRWWLGTLGVR